MTQTFTRGSVWDLTVNANCIPAGRYTLQDVHDEILIFTVGPRITFGVTRDFYAPFLRPIKDRRASKTSAATFVNRYVDLYTQQMSEPSGVSGLTFCAMDAQLQGKFHKLSRLAGTTIPNCACY